MMPVAAEDYDRHVQRSWTWFKKHGSPKYWLAPMVGASEPSFRLLVRRYNVGMASTEMVDAGGYAHSSKYRNQFHILDERDRPLIVQIGGANRDHLIKAALAAVPNADAVELNIGCPQHCARKAKPPFGAFMMNRPEELVETVRLLAQALELEGSGIPLLCKIRCYSDTGDTVELCKRLERAGCAVLTVHGRTCEDAQKGTDKQAKPLADWNKISAVKQALKIPIIGNGNIRCKADADAMIAECKVDGIMSGWGLLKNPALFDDTAQQAQDQSTRSVDLALQYVALCAEIETYHVSLAKHVQKILGPKMLCKYPKICKLLQQFASWHSNGGQELSNMDIIVDELLSVKANLAEKQSEKVYM